MDILLRLGCFGCVRHGQHEAVDILLRRGAQLHTELGGKTPVVLCLEVSEDDGDVCVQNLYLEVCVDGRDVQKLCLDICICVGNMFRINTLKYVQM